MDWRDRAQRNAQLKLDQARSILAACERDLHRILSDGECRDLLTDNTPWDREVIFEVVKALCLTA